MVAQLPSTSLQTKQSPDFAQTKHNLFKDHILVAEALHCNADECREIFANYVHRGVLHIVQKYPIQLTVIYIFLLWAAKGAKRGYELKKVYKPQKVKHTLVMV